MINAEISRIDTWGFSGKSILVELSTPSNRLFMLPFPNCIITIRQFLIHLTNQNIALKKQKSFLGHFLASLRFHQTLVRRRNSAPSSPGVALSAFHINATLIPSHFSLKIQIRPAHAERDIISRFKRSKGRGNYISLLGKFDQYDCIISPPFLPSKPSHTPLLALPHTSSCSLSNS